MNCKSALLGSSLADQFCPTAYKDLFQVADSLLSRMQAALREQALIIQELTAEKETAAEERIGFDMQVRHQKLQIKDMARNKEEQDTVIEDLVTQVAEIKQLRREEAEQRARTLRLVESNDSRRRRPRKQRTSLNSVDSTPSMTSAFDSDPREDEEDEEDGYDTPGTSVPPSPRMSWTGPLHVQHNDNLCRICRGPSGTHEWNQIQDENQALRGRVKTMEGELEGCLDMLQVFQIR